MRFVDLNNGYTYNGDYPYIHWFDDNQSTNLVYTKKLCIIDSSNILKVDLNSNMFRFEDYMPEYWENESRDFQLLTRLNDLIFMGQRADIATIQNLNSSKKCKNSLLPILAKKVGFFNIITFKSSSRGTVIASFKTVLSGVFSISYLITLYCIL